MGVRVLSRQKTNLAILTQPDLCARGKRVKKTKQKTLEAMAFYPSPSGGLAHRLKWPHQPSVLPAFTRKCCHVQVDLYVSTAADRSES